jgi:hypothetical protein
VPSQGNKTLVLYDAIKIAMATIIVKSTANNVTEN